jgi:glycosyltransferase involved in cell wall biosynthesis
VRLACTADATWQAGHEYLLVALDALRRRGHDVRLVLSAVGTAVERARYTVVDLGLDDAVELVDLRGARRRYQALVDADVVVLPALVARPWPELAEAQLVGRPLVATPEAWCGRPGAAAVTVPAHSPTALARALEAWCPPDGPGPGHPAGEGRAPARAS